MEKVKYTDCIVIFSAIDLLSSQFKFSTSLGNCKLVTKEVNEKMYCKVKI